MEMLRNGHFAPDMDDSLRAELYFDKDTRRCVAAFYFTNGSIKRKGKWLYSNLVKNKNLQNCLKGLYLLSPNDDVPIGRTIKAMIDDEYNGYYDSSTGRIWGALSKELKRQAKEKMMPLFDSQIV